MLSHLPKLRQETDAGGAPEASISAADRIWRFVKFVEKTNVENFSVVESQLALFAWHASGNSETGSVLLREGFQRAYIKILDSHPREIAS